MLVLTQYFYTFDNYHLYRELCRLYIRIYRCSSTFTVFQIRDADYYFHIMAEKSL